MGRLKQLADGLARQFGPDCEVVIHDLKTSEPEHSIVYIVNGHVTNRDIGDGPSNAVFDAIRNQEKGATPEDHTGYLMKTAEKMRIVKQSIQAFRHRLTAAMR